MWFVGFRVYLKARQIQVSYRYMIDAQYVYWITLGDSRLKTVSVS